MARRGPKGKPPSHFKAIGETRPSRQVVTLFADHASRPDPEDISPPSGMTAAAKKIWAEKVERYRQRGQKVDGFQDSLRQYCEIEAALAKAWKKEAATMAMVNAHRLWASEFFDTPAAQKVKPGDGGQADNPFKRRG